MTILTEKYRPKTIEEVVGLKPLGFKIDQDMPHLLLYGPPGTGKTSLAKIIIETLGADHKIFNSSMDRGIEIIRSKVSEFASTRSTDGNIKICFLDEADGLSYDAQNSLRNLMETYSDNFRLILTANNVEKINDAIRSRCTEIEFGNAPVDDIVHRLTIIVLSESIPYDLPGIRKIAEIGKGDIRRCINIIEDMRDGVFIDKVVVSLDTVEAVYMKLRRGDFIGAREIYLASKIDDIELLKGLHHTIFSSDDSTFSKCAALRCMAYCAARYNDAAWKEILVERTLLGISEAYTGKAKGYAGPL